MQCPSLTHVASYRRTVAATIERVWENVFDWEHLPWLHRRSFSHIELVASGSWGWRARLELQTPTGRGLLLELVRDGEANRYVARTLAGPGAGTEIWTELTPDGAATHVEVAFHVPGVPPGGSQAVGAAFTRLYAQLWDEDEAMMVHRARALAARRAPPPAASDAVLELGLLASLRARLPLCVELGGRSYRVVAVGGELYCHATACPHLLGPLDDCPVAGGRIRCPWHGYEFDVRTGCSSDGRGLRLPPAPRIEVDPATTAVRLIA